MHHDRSSIFVHDFKTVTAEVLQNVTNTKCVLLSVGDYLIKQKIELLKTKKILMKLLLWKLPSMVLLSYQLMKSS
jgi:hypothetical protein